MFLPVTGSAEVSILSKLNWQSKIMVKMEVKEIEFSEKKRVSAAMVIIKKCTEISCLNLKKNMCTKIISLITIPKPRPVVAKTKQK